MERNVAPSLGRLSGCTFDGVGNVVQLQIEKDPLAGRGEPAGEGEAFAAIGELHADFIEGRGVADPLDEAPGLADIG